MKVCQDYQFKSFDIFSFEKIVHPEILKLVPQSIADFASSHFPLVEGSFNYCKNLSELPQVDECHQNMKTVIKQNFHPLQISIYPSQVDIRLNGQSTFIERDTSFTRVENIHTKCSDWEINTETHLKDLVTQELDKTWQYQTYQRSNEIGLAAIALASSVLLGYGIYKIYKKCNQMPSPNIN